MTIDMPLHFQVLFNPVIHNGLGLPATIWLKEQLDALRATIPLNQYLDRIEPIASVLVHQDWLIPLFTIG